MSSGSIALSVIVTAHHEGSLVLPTLKSIREAISNFEIITSLSTELVIVLDNPSADTELLVTRWADNVSNFQLVRIIRTTHGEAGQARNSGIAASSGEYICCCDGDDLISSNFFTEAIKCFDTPDSNKLILHVAHLLSFGASPSIWHVKNADDPEVNVSDLLEANLWPSSSFSRRETYLENPYVPLPPKEGFGPEDWYWNIITSSRGYVHKTVPNTVFFYRVKKNSGVNSQHSASVLPHFDVAELVNNFPPSAETALDSGNRPTFKKRATFFTKRVIRKVLKVIKPISSVLAQPVKDAGSRKIRKALPGLFTHSGAEIHWSFGIEPLLTEATKLEPAISWPAHNAKSLVVWEPRNTGYGELLLSVMDGLKTHNQQIIFAPWLGIGGADMVTANYLAAFCDSEKPDDGPTLIATYDHTKTRHELIPNGTNFIQLPPMYLELDESLQRKLIAQVVILAKPKITLSINCFHMTNALSEFHKQICKSTLLYLSFFAFDQIGDGFPVNPITDDAERTFLNSIAGLITDNSATKNKLLELLGLPDEKILVHLQPGFVTTPKLRRYTAAFNDWEFTNEYPIRLLWPHRIDKEKRPEVLLSIAAEAKQQNLPIQIDVYGQRVLSAENDELFDLFKENGINFKGPYSNGLGSLPTRDYHALLLTSENEGTPLVVVQSMLLSLPVIATSVGGLPVLLDQGKAGFLVKHFTDTDSFVDSIRELATSREKRRSIIENAYERAYQFHSWETFTQQTVQQLKP